MALYSGLLLVLLLPVFSGLYGGGGNVPGFGLGGDGGFSSWREFFTFHMCSGLFLLGIGLLLLFVMFIVIREPKRQWIPDGQTPEALFLEWRAMKWHRRAGKRAIAFTAMAAGMLLAGILVVWGAMS